MELEELADRIDDLVVCKAKRSVESMLCWLGHFEVARTFTASAQNKIRFFFLDHPPRASQKHPPSPSRKKIKGFSHTYSQ